MAASYADDASSLSSRPPQSRAQYRAVSFRNQIGLRIPHPAAESSADGLSVLAMHQAASLLRVIQRHDVTVPDSDRAIPRSNCTLSHSVIMNPVTGLEFPIPRRLLRVMGFRQNVFHPELGKRSSSP